MVTSIGMTIEELEESLSEILFCNFKIKKTKGKIVIETNLSENEFGELVDLDEDLEDDDESDDSYEDLDEEEVPDDME